MWESNHVWLVIALVLLWTGFPVAFAPIFTTLFVPLSVAALGIVLRGAGFAFRSQVQTLRWQRVSGTVFALASLLTPFFLGTAIGAIVTGRVRAADGDPVSSWVNPTSLLTGALFVATSAYLAAAVVTGLLAATTMAVLHTTAARVFSILTTGRALPLVVISVLAGTAAAVLLALDKILIVVAIIVVLVGPSFVLPFSLAQRGTLSEPGER